MANSRAQSPRTVRDSQVIMSQVMLPGDANPQGNVHGGVIMKLVDTAAGVAAARHVRGRVVTARLDSMSFLQPVFIGDLVTVMASVNDVGHTSMEVGVRVEAEELTTGVVRHVSSAYLVMVALDDQGRPCSVPPLVAGSDVERQRMAEAKVRRDHRQTSDQAVRAMRDGGRKRATLEGWRAPGASLVVIGHRGAAGHAPENTMRSFEVALAAGADVVEIDVHLTRDGVPVVIHDATVDRTTSGKGAVADLTWEELRSFDATRGHTDVGGPIGIPTLDEVLRWARGKTRLQIELKGTGDSRLVGRVVDTIREYDLVRDVMLISFDHQALREARALCGEVLTGALFVGRPVDPASLAAGCGADALAPALGSLTRADVSIAHEAGLAVCVWTVNDPRDIERALELGVDAITSDFPDRVRATVLAVH